MYKAFPLLKKYRKPKIYNTLIVNFKTCFIEFCLHP